jgi:hypothetical protein
MEKLMIQQVAVEATINRGMSLTPINYAYYQLAKGTITRDQLNTMLNKYKTNNYARDYADNVLRRQVLQQYNLSLRSRSDHSSQNLTINYLYNNMGKVNSDKNQLNVNYKGVFDVAKWLTATFTLNGTFGRSKTPNTEVLGGSFSEWMVLLIIVSMMKMETMPGITTGLVILITVMNKILITVLCVTTRKKICITM